LRFPLTVLPTVLSALINTNISLARITNFLLKDELKKDDITHNDDLKDLVVSCSNVNLGWNKNEATLKK